MQCVRSIASCSYESVQFGSYCRLVWLLCFLSFRYWALAVPSFVIVAVALSMVIYMGLNFLATPPPTSFSTIFGDTQFLSPFVFSYCSATSCS